MKRLLIATVIVASASAHAQPAQDAPIHDDAKVRSKDLFTAGTKQYDLRDYKGAIESFRKAYDLVPEPLFLFDIGQAYRQLRDCDNARSFYKTYLRNLPASDNQAKVERFIADMDECVREQEQARVQERERARPPAIVAPPPVRTSHRGLAIGGVAIAIGGIALAGIGIYYSVDASNQARRIETSCQFGCDGADVAPTDQRGRDADRNAIILYSVGGAAIATGIGMVLWATLKTDETVIVTPKPGGATLSATVRF